MGDLLLDRYELRAKAPSRPVILPDGCRDLVYRAVPGERPVWHVTQLDDAARTVEVATGTTLAGFRLRPGAHVDVERLLASVRGRDPDARDITARLEETCTVERQLADALAALARCHTDIESTARDLGITTRTLQRVVTLETGKPPSFWLQLARVRRAARDLSTPRSIAEVAFQNGFADQAHFTRAVRRWLGTTPSLLRADPHAMAVLTHSGYP